MRISDWSSDVCSSDLGQPAVAAGEGFVPREDAGAGTAAPAGWSLDGGGGHQWTPLSSPTASAIALVALTTSSRVVSRPKPIRTVAAIASRSSPSACSVGDEPDAPPLQADPVASATPGKIGRGSCRGRVCQYVEISGV